MAAQFSYTSDGTSVTIRNYRGNDANVVIPETIDGLPVTAIGELAFRGTRLISITIPTSVTSIWNHAFYSCTSLTTITIPNSVTSIGNQAFYSCRSLTTITIPHSVTSIGESVCYRCTGLVEIIVEADNPVYSSLDGALFDKNQTTLMQYPAGKGGNYTLPESVTRIETSAFRFSSNLLAITVAPANPAYSSRDGVLYDKNFTTLLQYPGGKTGDYVIPDGIADLGNAAFSYCDGLTSATIPGSINSIASSAFRSCSGLSSITVDPINPTYSSLDGVLYNKNFTTLLQYPGGKAGDYTISPNALSIEGHAFYSCNNLTELIFPKSLTSIGNYSFYSCTSLASVALSESLTSIGDSAFRSCRNLASVTFSGSLTSLDNSAFSSCTSLTTVTLPESLTSIGNSAFSSCTSLASVSLPDSLTSIGNSAFRFCSNLTSVIFPKNLTSIGDSAFSSCTSLTSVTFPDGLTSIGNYAFLYCNSLTSSTFAGNAPALGHLVFFDVAPEFTIYYYNGSTGFTTPTWNGYRTVMLSKPPTPPNEEELTLLHPRGRNVHPRTRGARRTGLWPSASSGPRDRFLGNPPHHRPVGGRRRGGADRSGRHRPARVVPRRRVGTVNFSLREGPAPPSLLPPGCEETLVPKKGRKRWISALPSEGTRFFVAAPGHCLGTSPG